MKLAGKSLATTHRRDAARKVSSGRTGGIAPASRRRAAEHLVARRPDVERRLRRLGLDPKLLDHPERHMVERTLARAEDTLVRELAEVKELRGIYREGVSSRGEEPLTATEATALKEDGVDILALDPGTPAQVRRAEAKYSELVQKSLLVEEAARRLHVNSSRIRQRLADRSLYGIKVGTAWRLPSFQFTKQGLVPNIDKLLPSVPPDLHPLAVYNWLHRPNPDLPDAENETPLTPLQWLRTGHPPEPAAALAADL